MRFTVGDIAHTSLSPDVEDSWLDRISEHRERQRSRFHAFWHESITYPILWTKKLLQFLSTTPGRMTTLIVVLSITILSAGVSMSQTSADRRADLKTLIDNTEPVSYLAQNLYSSLSLANTTASVSFVRAGVDTSENRQRYEQAIQNASRAVAQTAGGLSENSGHQLELLTHISEQIPIYTGLVETAWANNRQGNPVGVAYMSQASTLMREQILPAAAELYTLTSNNVTNEQQQLARPLWVPLGGLFIALIMLLLGQLWIAHVTRRRLNGWFVLATLLMVIATTWVSTASFLTWSASSTAYQTVSSPLQSLTDARIRVQQARSSETLAFVWRQSLENSNTNFNAALDTMDKALNNYENSQLVDNANNREHLNQAVKATKSWRSSHEKLAAALNSGDYEEALALTLYNDTSAATPSAFNVLDSSLAKLIDDARQTARGYITRGANASDVVSTMVLVFTLVSVLSLWLGIRPRLQEYL
ncbi:Phenol hydroxylase [Corynebacterium pseudotuberculosis]|uniref:MCP four helix bundle domain-containing protein n=1 Tax=Corynebacterium pseudotuberculosis TaxID=1719 RepID=UPI00065E9ABD|nr:MCP four helix bundle domain-containing protein [Corynebacterium pseudotuberculosis]AKP09439.1 Phenol hydroxylase [Corynebacterium pseudotuberculosis]